MNSFMAGDYSRRHEGMPGSYRLLYEVIFQTQQGHIATREAA
jgi:hypothetical protein